MYIPYIICDFPTDPSFSLPFLLLALPSPRPSFLQVLLLLALPSSPRPSFLQVLLLCCRLSFCSQPFFRVATLPSAPCPSFGPALLPCCSPSFCSQSFFRVAALPSAPYSSSVLPVLFLEGWLAIYMNYTVFCFNEVACLCL